MSHWTILKTKTPRSVTRDVWASARRAHRTRIQLGVRGKDSPLKNENAANRETFPKVFSHVFHHHRPAHSRLSLHRLRPHHPPSRFHPQVTHPRLNRHRSGQPRQPPSAPTSPIQPPFFDPVLGSPSPGGSRPTTESSRCEGPRHA